MPIHFQSIDYRYPASSNGVFNINLTIGDSEFLAVIGPSGSGKTTLPKLLWLCLWPSPTQKPRT